MKCVLINEFYMSLIILTISFFHPHRYPWHMMSISVFSTQVLLLLSRPWNPAPSKVLVLYSMCLSKHLLPLTWIPYVFWHDLLGSMSTYKNRITRKLSQEFFDYFLLLNLWTTWMNSELVSPHFPCSWLWSTTWKSQSTLLLIFDINNLKLEMLHSEHSWNSVALYFECNIWIKCNTVLPIDD